MLEKEKREKLFECVRKDDAAAFGELASPEVLSAVFGRFPLLSLLYLFNAKRIVKKYYSELVKERPRGKEEPFRKADELFLTRAGKCLRYYSAGEVSPLEMLAVLGRGKELERLYAVYPNASRFLPMLHKIYFTRLGEGIAVIGDKLVLPKEPLSFKEKKTLTAFATAFLAAFLVVLAVTVFSFLYFGTGSEKSFYKAHSAEATLSALERNYCVSLEKDLSLSGGTEEFSGVFDGGEHILRLKAPFAQTLTGEIRNVIFVLEEGFAGDAVILENQGVLKNVRVVAEDLSFEKGGEHMGLLTAHNGGTIQDSFAVMKVTVEGEGGGDCFFAPFAGLNEGTVHNCVADGEINAKNVDIAGIAGKNGEKGTITDCVVKADFEELSDIKRWTPNVAGVAAQNDGTIYGCTVEGTLSSTLRAPALEEEESPASAYAGGITCVNAGTVNACRNQSAVFAFAENGYAFAGGVVCVNYAGTVQDALSGGAVKAQSSTHNACAGGIAAENNQGTVTHCGQTSSVTAAAPDGAAYSFAGGIVGYNNGTITKSFYTGAIPAYDTDSYSGGICGVIFLPYSLRVAMEDNYFTGDGHVSGAVISEWMYYDLRPGYIYGLALFESNEAYAPYIEGILDFGGAKTTAEELKTKEEVYYE